MPGRNFSWCHPILQILDHSESRLSLPTAILNLHLPWRSDPLEQKSSYPTSEYLPPICLISEYGNLFRYSYPLTQESRPQLLEILSPGVSQTHSIGNSILSSTTDSSLWFHSECTLFAHRLFVFNFYGSKISTLLCICQFYFQNIYIRISYIQSLLFLIGHFQSLSL